MQFDEVAQIGHGFLHAHQIFMDDKACQTLLTLSVNGYKFLLYQVPCSPKLLYPSTLSIASNLDTGSAERCGYLVSPTLIRQPTRDHPVRLFAIPGRNVEPFSRYS